MLPMGDDEREGLVENIEFFQGIAILNETLKAV
jgi:hypothetical protein